MNDSYWTSDIKDLKEWDNFLINNKRGHYLQSSHWLRSYEKFNFNFEVCIVKDKQGKIIAGMGVVLAGIKFLKVLVAPCSPIISEGNEHLFDNLINTFLKKAKQQKVFYCHINVPLLKDENQIIQEFCLNAISPESVFFSGHDGIKFKHVSSTNGFRSVPLEYSGEVLPYDLAFKNFNSNTKRNVKKAKKNNLKLVFAKTEEQIRNAYSIIEHNGKSQGYAVRTWDDMGDMIVNMVKNNICIVPCCYLNNDLIGALVVFEIGKRLTYISGGTLRTLGDFKVGHFLHNEMIKYSINKGYSFYDISVGGSPGVTRFKEGFNGHHVEFIAAKYWILNKFKYWLYANVSPQISKHKSFISRVLKN